MKSVTLRRSVADGNYTIVDGNGFVKGTVVGHQWIDGVIRCGDTVTILGDEKKPEEPTPIMDHETLVSEFERVKMELGLSERQRESLRDDSERLKKQMQSEYERAEKMKAQRDRYSDQLLACENAANGKDFTLSQNSSALIAVQALRNNTGKRLVSEIARIESRLRDEFGIID